VYRELSIKCLAAVLKRSLPSEVYIRIGPRLYINICDDIFRLNYDCSVAALLASKRIGIKCI